MLTSPALFSSSSSSPALDARQLVALRRRRGLAARQYERGRGRRRLAFAGRGRLECRRRRRRRPARRPRATRSSARRLTCRPAPSRHVSAPPRARPAPREFLGDDSLGHERQPPRRRARAHPAPATASIASTDAAASGVGAASRVTDAAATARTRAISSRADAMRLSRIRGFPHAMQFVERGLQHADRGLVGRDATRLERSEERLHLVAQVAHGAYAGHARPALQRVQDALQLRDAAAIRAVRGPVRQRGIGLLEQLGRLLAEDRRDVGVEIRLGLLVGRRRRGPRPRQRPGRREQRLRRQRQVGRQRGHEQVRLGQFLVARRRASGVSLRPGLGERALARLGEPRELRVERSFERMPSGDQRGPGPGRSRCPPRRCATTFSRQCTVSRSSRSPSSGSPRPLSWSLRT